jgi:hypothetical protein
MGAHLIPTALKSEKLKFKACNLMFFSVRVFYLTICHPYGWHSVGSRSYFSFYVFLYIWFMRVFLEVEEDRWVPQVIEIEGEGTTYTGVR